MTRNVTDAAVLLGAMTGVDPNDPATAAQAGHAFTDYTQFLDADALDGARIGVWRDGTYDPTDQPRGRRDHERRRSTCSRPRARRSSTRRRSSIEAAYGPEFAALLCEFKDDIATYLADVHRGRATRRRSRT